MGPPRMAVHQQYDLQRLMSIAGSEHEVNAGGIACLLGPRGVSRKEAPAVGSPIYTSILVARTRAEGNSHLRMHMKDNQG